MRNGLARNHIVIFFGLKVKESRNLDAWWTLSTIIALLKLIMCSDRRRICLMRKATSDLMVFVQLLFCHVHFSRVLTLIDLAMLSHVVNRALIMTSNWLVVIESINCGIWQRMTCLIAPLIMKNFGYSVIFFVIWRKSLVTRVTNLVLPRWELAILLPCNFRFNHSEWLVEFRIVVSRWLVKYLYFHCSLVLLLWVFYLDEERLDRLLSGINLGLCIREGTVSVGIGVCCVSIQHDL